MRRILAVGTSVLLLSATASLGQERDIGELDDGRKGGQAQADAGTNQQNQDDAIVERPVPPSMVDNSSWPAEIPFPAQDVSDNDLEPGNTPYPSGYPESAVHGVGEPGLNGAYEDSAQDAGSGNGAPGMTEERQTRSQEGEGSPEFSAEQGPAAAWDGPEEGAPFHRGDLMPERSGAADGAKAEKGQSERTNPRARRQAMDRDALGERRLRLGRIALRSARYAVPEANFRTYSFEVENGQRVIEIAGISRESGRRVEVDVRPNGHIQSISHAISMDEVPAAIRVILREELQGFRAAQVLRSLVRDFDVYYEFAGFSANGRPVTASIRADGSDFSVRYWPQG